MGFFAKLFPRNRISNAEFMAVRMSSRGHHYYTILASDKGFEFVFRSGRDRWSTISPSFASRLIKKNIAGEIGSRVASNRKEFLELAIGTLGNGHSPWTPSKAIPYTTREQALQSETEILDISWASAKDGLDDE